MTRDVGSHHPNGTTLAELGDGRRLHGFADERFGKVVDAFVANFIQRHDLGAGCAVYVEGRSVVDLWGGIAERRTRLP